MKICKQCVLPETYPGIQLDGNGTCCLCRESKNNTRIEPGEHFRTEEELVECIQKRKKSNGKYNVLVPISGGVDSCNTLITIVEKYKLRVLAFHNDHGYEDETATENTRKLCKQLNVDLLLLQQDILFMKKLWKYINEADVIGINSCYVCGNILFLNALEAADRFAVPMVINGYSKGQAAMTRDKDQGSRLLEKVIEIIEKTGDKDFFDQFLDKYKILEKKVDYQSKEDLKKPVAPGKILFIPFYIFDFYKTDKEALKEKIKKRFDWQPMKTSYPNRTTNCQMIWLNTYMDRNKMGYSLYELEYSELVRRGELTREQALSDLEFNPPIGVLEQLAGEIGIEINNVEKPTHSQNKEADKTHNNVNIEFDF